MVENTFRPVVVVDIIILAGKLEKNQNEFLNLVQRFVGNPRQQFHIVPFYYFCYISSFLHQTKTLFIQCATWTIHVAVKSEKSKECVS